MTWSKEPAVWVGLLQAVLALAVGFGLDITEEQLALSLAVAAAVSAVVVRSRVSPTSAIDHV